MVTEIKAVGCWSEDRPYSETGKWNINYSSILTKLIQQTGKYCESYASDLFISWNTVEEELNKGEDIHETYIFALRDMGVDHKFYYENRLNEPEIYGSPNYHEVWELTIDANKAEHDIKMKLKLIEN